MLGHVFLLFHTTSIIVKIVKKNGAGCVPLGGKSIDTDPVYSKKPQSQTDQATNSCCNKKSFANCSLATKKLLLQKSFQEPQSSFSLCV
jgi:hypothetical protein